MIANTLGLMAGIRSVRFAARPIFDSALSSLHKDSLGSDAIKIRSVEGEEQLKRGKKSDRLLVKTGCFVD